MKSFLKLSFLLAINWSSLALSQVKDEATPSIPTRLPAAEAPSSGPLMLKIDASDKTNFVYLGLAEGKLVPVTEKDTWIFGVRRYIFKTQTGVNGPFEGGAAVAAGEGFEAFKSCSKLSFEADQDVTMLGYTVAANALMTSEWFDYNEEGAVTPMDKLFALSRDKDCLKVKILKYEAGVYEIEYQQVL